MGNNNSNDYMTALAGEGYQFRYNEVTDRVEVNGVPINDPFAAEIRVRMRDMGFLKPSEFEDAYIANAYLPANRYHPIRAYLTGLAWDGTDHIGRLGSHFSDERRVFHMFFQRWIIGAVAKVFESAQNFMLVLDGVQGRGKSYFVKWLCPAQLTDYFIESAIDTGDKDYAVRLASKWIWEVSELGATTRKSDREALKHFISQQQVSVRQAYARFSTDRPALASMIGTINDEGGGFLNDPTGNRRFAVVTLTNIDWGYTNIDPNQLWAQAVYLYRNGEDWRLTQDEQAIQNEINETYTAGSFFEDLFLRTFDIQSDPGADWMATADIILEMEKQGLATSSQRHAEMELSKLAKKLAIPRQRILQKNGNRRVCYQGVVNKSTFTVTP